MPDEVGNLFKTKERNDKEYGAGGKLLRDQEYHYFYDAEGNLTAKNGKDSWKYNWLGNGMLKEVTRPDGKKVGFEYDALGRRTAKIYEEKINRFVWDGNTPLHEWKYDLAQKPQWIVDEIGFLKQDQPEPVSEDLITWVFEEGTFKPTAKIIGTEKYSIVTDYLGTPCQAFDSKGEKVWEAELDIYGKSRKLEGAIDFVPFRYQGQYEDVESGLYYNRFRYYCANTGNYLSQDPIGLAGGTALYGYVYDTNGWVDVFGLNGNEFDVGLHEDLLKAKTSPDLRSHHVGQKVIMKDLVANYDEMKAPAILVDKVGHNNSHPDLGTVAAIDGNLNPNTPAVSGAAYTNSFAMAATTNLFTVDYTTNMLYNQTPPNDGTLVAVGPLGIDIEADNGFDIGGNSGTAFGLFKVGGMTAVYSINLTTGAATKVADFNISATAMAVGLGF